MCCTFGESTKSSRRLRSRDARSLSGKSTYYFIHTYLLDDTTHVKQLTVPYLATRLFLRFPCPVKIGRRGKKCRAISLLSSFSRVYLGDRSKSQLMKLYSPCRRALVVSLFLKDPITRSGAIRHVSSDRSVCVCVSRAFPSTQTFAYARVRDLLQDGLPQLTFPLIFGSASASVGAKSLSCRSQPTTTTTARCFHRARARAVARARKSIVLLPVRAHARSARRVASRGISLTSFNTVKY